MHYMNGREAKNGDKVVIVPVHKDASGKLYGAPTAGILYDAQPGNDYCNGRIALISNNNPQPNLKECLHLDDFMALFTAPAQAPDTSKPAADVPAAS